MTQVTELRVFVASPGDTKDERDIVPKVIERVNNTVGDLKKIKLRPVMWEHDAWPGFGEDAQDVINRQTGHYDIFVGIMWNRIGTPTKRAPSGTHEEFSRAYDRWKEHRLLKLMFYFNTKPLYTNSVELHLQAIEVLRFKEHLHTAGGLYREYNGTAEFEDLLSKHLSEEVKVWQTPDSPHIIIQRKREVFNEKQNWDELTKRGRWRLTDDKKIVGEGVNNYLLSRFFQPMRFMKNEDLRQLMQASFWVGKKQSTSILTSIYFLPERP